METSKPNDPSGGNNEDQNGPIDNLATLASAALNQTMQGTEERRIPADKMEPSVWYDVGIVKGTTVTVKNFYAADCTNEHTNTTSDNLPQYVGVPKIDLEPGTAYKLRVAAINSLGRGEWSDVAAFKTCLPGYPGAPSSIKISKSAEGAHLSWEPPASSSGKILEYSVCLAIKNPDAKPGTAGGGGQLAFARVYCGRANNCPVSTDSLSYAYVDVTTKPAIIFRIAAKNEKGYGPATQVRWLQDSLPPSKPGPTVKRGEKPPTTNPQGQKKYRP